LPRLDVAVDEAELVGGGQPEGGLAGDADRLREGRGALAPQVLVERVTLEELQGNVRGAVDLVGLVDVHHEVAADPSSGAGFPQEAVFRRRVGGGFGKHHLERDLLFEAFVECQVDGPHPAAAEFLLNAVLAEATEFAGSGGQGEAWQIFRRRCGRDDADGGVGGRRERFV